MKTDILVIYNKIKGSICGTASASVPKSLHPNKNPTLKYDIQYHFVKDNYFRSKISNN